MIVKGCILPLCGSHGRKLSADTERALESILKITKMDRNPMKRKASISHDEAIIRRLRRNPDFAGEYLKSTLQDEDGPRVLFIALRHLVQARGIAAKQH